MSGREKLPQRRSGETLEFQASGLVYTATLGRFPDGRLGEVFLRCGKSGTHASIACAEAAIAASFALQFGATAETMRAAMPRTGDGKAEGALGALLDMLAEGGQA